MTFNRQLASSSLLIFLLSGCATLTNGDDAGVEGLNGQGGAQMGSGGNVSASGGTAQAGTGASAPLGSGGSTASGGTAASGGTTATGGAASGGTAATGGAASGGTTATGGAASGGTTATGGAASGGTAATGGTTGGGDCSGATAWETKRDYANGDLVTYGGKTYAADGSVSYSRSGCEPGITEASVGSCTGQYYTERTDC